MLSMLTIWRTTKINKEKSSQHSTGKCSSLSPQLVFKKMENHQIVCSSYALITPENDHGCNISFGLKNFLIEQISKEKDVKKVIFWSDGYASQFRSQYALYMLAKFDTDIGIQWHYFQANHGKGAVVRIGVKSSTLYFVMLRVTRL